MYLQIGIYAIYGATFLLTLTICQSYIAYVFGKIRAAILSARDVLTSRLGKLMPIFRNIIIILFGRANVHNIDRRIPGQYRSCKSLFLGRAYAPASPGTAREGNQVTEERLHVISFAACIGK